MANFISKAINNVFSSGPGRKFLGFFVGFLSHTKYKGNRFFEVFSGISEVFFSCSATCSILVYSKTSTLRQALPSEIGAFGQLESRALSSSAEPKKGRVLPGALYFGYFD